MEASSRLTAKIVEYHDPSRVFQLVSKDIASRLPLRNLNWQTPSRPLRQIRQLHVEFVSDSESFPAARDPRAGTRERRHQIPGLKTSPYLKIYVLRCDDKEQYKEDERARIRKWVKTQTRVENHDACQWLVLHVVIPNTVAASEPRWRESQSEPDTLKERQKTVKLPGKSSRTVFDRLRADFNEGGKGGIDRVAQIRVLKEDMPPELLPTPPAASPLKESQQERDIAWKDLMDKIKSLILSSFDTRVRQYEADITVQQSRRSLPGWNFCTFFVHKEGLGKALESVGLVEDALVIYDELSLGLEMVLRDIASGKADGTATTFADYTEDIEQRILDGNAGALSATNYRERIVRSSISIFDFFGYLFLRQKSIILRLANAQRLRGEREDGGEDLVLTSEVCWRGSSFIHNGARMLRQDLARSPAKRSKADIDALVSSWIYSITEQVLMETAAPILETIQDGDDETRTNGTLTPKGDTFTFGMGANPYPQRSSSLFTSKPELQKPPSVDLTSPPSTAGSKDAKRGEIFTTPKGAGFPGLPELATYRAEVVMMQRRAIETVAAQQGWYAGWAAFHHLRNLRLGKKNVEADMSEHISPELLSLLESESSFQDTYMDLCDQAMRYYALATQSKYVEPILRDLAMLRLQQGDAAAAEEYLQHLLPSNNTGAWSAVHTELLSIYGACLKRLDRIEDYIKSSLDLLAEVCGKLMARESTKGDVDVTGLLDEVISLSEDLPQDLMRPAEQFFTSICLGIECHHCEEDGFTLNLRFRHVLVDEVEMTIKALLVSVDDSSQTIDLCSAPTIIRKGLNQVQLRARTVALGAFDIGPITLIAKKLRFLHESQRREPVLKVNDIDVPDSPSEFFVGHEQPRVLVYPPETAFDANLSLPRDLQVGRVRKMHLTLSSGRNDVHGIVVNLRPTSAGLRLHLADIELVGIERANGKTLGFALAGMEAGHKAAVIMPYTVEQNVHKISIRVQISYETSKGSFRFLSSPTLRHGLPLDVDVNDIFHMDRLFSNFTIRSTDKQPLTILKTSLSSSPAYTVRAPPPAEDMMTIEHLPAKLMYQITRVPESSVRRQDAALILSIHYLSAQELLVEEMRQLFSKRLEDSRYKGLSRLLVPFVIERSKTVIQVDMETVMFRHEMAFPNFAEFGWGDVINALPTDVRLGLQDWLENWHTDHENLPVDLHSATAKHSARLLRIPVDVPTVDAVFHAALEIDKGHVLKLGEPVEAKLKITHTNDWSSRSVFGEGSGNTREYIVDIGAEADTWLIGGRTRVHIQGSTTLPLMLVPLKGGGLHLPRVHIRAEQDKGTTCETYYESGRLKAKVI
ncbi:hypothetical protein K470DRAFT_283809 [Piedraia hortae CBS 480.64]|uniref:TMEM1 family protein-like protein n=1 Tax=Piedraia hortae CBS 480.64 TaxID=1314780 RepID=A0A6A7BSF1_9PEZI|nr:hypothetical protein K470DRAFT_283809 [Piedraia hortae CBS 480.64]